MQHPKLGELTHDEGIWLGEIEQVGSTIGIAIAGDETGPDARQVESLLQRLAAFDQLRSLTFDFIDDQFRNDSRRDSGPFTIKSLDFLWPRERDYFMVWLELEGDEFGAWKVEFVDGRPTYLSRDD